MFNKVWLRDAAERIVSTFLFAFIPSILALGWDSWRESLGIAGAAALGSLLKAMAGTQVGNPESASVLPTEEP